MGAAASSAVAPHCASCLDAVCVHPGLRMRSSCSTTRITCCTRHAALRLQRQMPCFWIHTRSLLAKLPVGMLCQESGLVIHGRSQAASMQLPLPLVIDASETKHHGVIIGSDSRLSSARRWPDLDFPLRIAIASGQASILGPTYPRMFSALTPLASA